MWGDIANYLTPKEDPDPLARNTRFGWGWFLLVGYFNYAFQTAVVVTQGVKDVDVAEAVKLFVNIGSLLIIVLVYFRIRKRLIEKRRYGNNIGMASFMAGIWASAVGVAVSAVFVLGINFYR